MMESKPTIMIYYSSKINEFSPFSDLKWGIEEEGIPFEIKNIEEESAIVLGYEAAKNSRLDVGIGIGSDRSVVLHYVKLKEDSPLFEVNIKSSDICLRALGSNAARLVKRMPFKRLEDRGYKAVKKNLEYSEDAMIIKAITEEVLKHIGKK